jgi:hypothetical protein
VIAEKKQLADQRANVRNQENVIEKAKGVDIALSVRMLEDAYHNNYDMSYLVTSDVDYLPVIVFCLSRNRNLPGFGVARCG